MAKQKNMELTRTLPTKLFLQDNTKLQEDYLCAFRLDPSSFPFHPWITEWKIRKQNLKQTRPQKKQDPKNTKKWFLII